MAVESLEQGRYTVASDVVSAGSLGTTGKFNLVDRGLVHMDTTLEKFVNGVFILKKHQMFFVHCTLQEF